MWYQSLVNNVDYAVKEASGSRRRGEEDPKNNCRQRGIEKIEL